jgi:hypothetical protein
MSIPTKIQAGDTIAWTDTLADYPADVWTLEYVLFRFGQSAVKFAGVADGTDHAFAVTPTISAAIAPGEWMWSAHVSNVGGDRYTIDTGKVTVKPDLAAAVPGSDFRGPAETAYDNVVDAINRLSAREVASITVNGRTVTYKDLDSLVKAEAILRPKMLVEKAAATGTTVSRLVRAQFGRA